MHTVEKTSSDNPTLAEKKKREKSPLTKILPTDRIAFERQVEILRAYAACYESNGGRPVSNEEAGNTLPNKFSAATLAVAVPFFTDVSIIVRNEDKFVPSAELVAYNQAIALSPTEAKRKIRPLFENTWFCRLLAPRLRLAPQSLNECVAVLAIEANATAVEYIKRVEPLIKFLELAGIVSISGNTVSFIPAGFSPETDEEEIRKKIKKGEIPEVFSLNQKSSLFLDKERAREVTLDCPFSITEAELQRIFNWIRATWIIEEETKDKM